MGGFLLRLGWVGRARLSVLTTSPLLSSAAPVVGIVSKPFTELVPPTPDEEENLPLVLPPNLLDAAEDDDDPPPSALESEYSFPSSNDDSESTSPSSN